MMQPRHKFVDFVLQNCHLLHESILWHHAAYFDNPDICFTGIDWNDLSNNPSPHAIALLEAHPTEINWLQLSANPSAMHLLRRHPDRISWFHLSRNPAPEAIAMLAAQPHKICHRQLHRNESPAALSLLRQHADVNEKLLSYNACAIDWTMTHPRTIHWGFLSRNPAAMSLLLANPEKIDWFYFSLNPAPEAIALLRAQPDKIYWTQLSGNPGIFELDYAAMRAQMAPMREELLRHCMHPRRLHQAEHDWLLF
jgi:hypothetical protein